ncbi:MAG: lactate utilization protein C [Bryobacteraceae bacterium]
MSAAKPDARQEILDRIRKATGGPGNRATEYAAIPREYRREGGMAAEARLELFAARLYEYGASVYRCTAAQIADAVAQALNARRRSAIVVSHGVPASWLPDGFEFVEDAALSYTALDQSNGVLTGCEAAVAFTGTIILRHGPGQARRAVTLVPDYHLCVVRAEQVVETLPEAIRRVEEFRAAPLTTISGPSATSDIEMTRVKGVHGPRTLDVVLVR